jgi:hypothetical protein
MNQPATKSSPSKTPKPSRINDTHNTPSRAKELGYIDQPRPTEKYGSPSMKTEAHMAQPVEIFDPNFYHFERARDYSILSKSA